MRLQNVLLFIFPPSLALVITFFVSVIGFELIVSFLVILDMVISSLMILLFFIYWRLNKTYEKAVLSLAKRAGTEAEKYRVAVVIPTYNEKPELVVGTALASKMAVRGFGDVFILDDSTDKSIKRELDLYSEIYGFSIVRRGDRKGYKAGAVNAWLTKYGGNYDLLIIMDADQRPMPGILEHALKFFDDPDVAYVQIPQYYSSLDNTVTLSAYIQQLPFLRIVMRGRSIRGTAFSLGSGTIYRIKHLLSVGGLYEETVTEDIFTSLLLHERNYKSVYVDLPLVWRGEAPNDLPSYMTQQNRWSLGGFQLIKKLLSVKLSFSALLDYLAGIYYWFHVGPLSLIDVLATVLFLTFETFFIAADPTRYIVAYFPIFSVAIMLYLIVMKRHKYGLREFIYHQGIQFVAFLPTIISVFEWALRRRKGFKVTSKGKKGATFTVYHLCYVFIVVTLISAILIGVRKALDLQGALLYAYIINLLWAGWWLVVSASSLYVSFALPVPHRFGRKIAQAYEGLEENVLNMLDCAEALEKAIANHYLQASEKFKEFSEPLKNIAMESIRHAEIYSKIHESIKNSVKHPPAECGWIEPYLCKIAKAKESEDIANSVLIQEEMTLHVFTQLVLETCRLLLENTEEIATIVEDEARHEKILRGILEEVKHKPR